MLSNESHMQQGVRLSGAIDIGATGDRKSHPQIEAYRLFILLVDVKFSCAVSIYRIGHKAPACAFAPSQWMDKEHLDLGVDNRNKPGNLTCLVADTGQCLNRGQGIPNQGAEELDVMLGHKVMRCPHRRFPYLQHAREI